MSNEYLEAMLDIFLYESEQIIEQLEQITLAKKDEDFFDESSINEIFRMMHTIKGSSGTMMYNNIATLSHKLEDVFYYLRESHPNNVPHAELVGYILDVNDFIRVELDKIKDGVNPDGNPKELINKIQIFLDKIKNDVTSKGEELPPENVYVEPKKYYVAPVATEESKFYKIFIYYRSDTEMCNIRAYTAVYALKEVAEDLLYEPEDIITNEDSSEVILKNGFCISLQTKATSEQVLKLIDHSSGVQNIEIEECDAEEFLNNIKSKNNFKDNLKQKPKAIDLELDLGDNSNNSDEAETEEKTVTTTRVPSQKAKENNVVSQPKQSFISVNVNKMDLLMDLIGEIVIAEAVVLQNPDLKVPGLDLTNFYKAAAQLSKITTELQDTIMTMRMMPLNNTFQKMNRIVYDVSRKLNKDIELEIIGENTEVDKKIIESISDPIMHLVRNAVDHGIESKEERRQAGKQDKGIITLEAKNEGGKVWITVKDNGKGLSKEKLLKKARENGLLSKSEKDLTDKEIYNLITLPGFSTKEEVTEYSGRGVGMDVVAKNIQGVGGSLEIDSKEGIGTTMTLKIPLTLAIIDGILIGVGDATYVVATGAIKEFVRVKSSQLITEPEGEEFIMIRGESFPVIRLKEYYHTGGFDNIEDGILAILEHEDKRLCIFVDKLIGEQEIVVKPMPTYIKKVKGISGCTQLGDGSISLIIDTGGLLQE